MIVIYQTGIYIYYFTILIASFFNSKARLWITGRKNSFKLLKENINPNDNIYWFHCASLGEFEQGKPIIDLVKKNKKDIKILITFFSPSGYELRKNYTNADCIVYMPLDTPSNAKKFLEIVNPQKAFFIKYEFWFNYLNELNKKKTPTFLISGVFRKGQVFFRWYGSLHKQMLKCFSHFFVQNEISKELLNSISINNVTVTGDTRMDRVYENSQHPISLPLIESFRNNKKLIVLGSSWKEEEEIIATYISSSKKDFKFIIAPHNISPQRIQSIKRLLNSGYICYSKIEENNHIEKEERVLIIDNIGILAHIYQYSDIAFIGGGFKEALHNILEPASFSNVVLFGPNHHKFHEAKDLIGAGGAYEIKDTDDLIAIINRLVTDKNMQKSQINAFNYVKKSIGATELIFKTINQ